MDLESFSIAEEAKPIAAYLNSPSTSSLAVIIGVDGPSYRPLGAMMTLLDNDQWIGTLSSGCIESDINLQAKEANQAASPKIVKYGKGSPYLDIQLPCGGGMEVLVLPNPDITILERLYANLKKRISCTLKINVSTGEIDIEMEVTKTIRLGDDLFIRYEPDPLFYIFGKGPEATTFTALVNAAGYPNLLLSPDDETLATGKKSGCLTLQIAKPHFPVDLVVDNRTAVILFFHDHDWEPDILIGALQTDAFYIGAQGSKAADVSRKIEMKTKGASHEDLERLVGPVGLIPSVRDAKTLAISVLAEILLKAQTIKF